MLITYCFVSLIVGTLICLLAGKKNVWVIQIAYAAAVVACIITAAKLSPIIPNVFVSVAIGLYSMTFLLTDFLGEVYTKKEALRAVYMGIIAEIIVIFALLFSIKVPSAPFWENQDPLQQY